MHGVLSRCRGPALSTRLSVPRRRFKADLSLGAPTHTASPRMVLNPAFFDQILKIESRSDSETLAIVSTHGVLKSKVNIQQADAATREA